MHILCKLGFHKWEGPTDKLQPGDGITCLRCAGALFNAEKYEGDKEFTIRPASLLPMPKVNRPKVPPPAPPLMRNPNGKKMPTTWEMLQLELTTTQRKLSEANWVNDLARQRIIDLDAEIVKIKSKLDLANKVGKAMSGSLGRVVTERDELYAKSQHVIQLTPAEIQSGLDRVRWAEALIRQLPEDHDGRNSWLLNYKSDPAND